MPLPNCYRCESQPCLCDGTTLYHGDCLEVMAALPENSIDLICSDPPYYKVKREWWDRQWDKPAEFLAWMGRLCDQWKRVLRPNGSLYVFASPKMAARVECLVGERMAVLNSITWLKHDGTGPWQSSGGTWRKACKEELRAFFPRTETIVFAEHYNADNAAKGEAGYGSKCDELRGFVFEPLRAYLDGERKRAGIDKADCNAACGFSRTPGGMASRHYFSRSQWCLPTREHYDAMRGLFNAGCNGSPQYLRREYEDLRSEYEDLRSEYEDLRREYEDLRRPFEVSASVPYTDVWDFPTVQNYRGKHPCEKPAELIQHILTTSGRDGCVVLDCFAGSGQTLHVARKLGYSAVGVEIEEKWCRRIAERLRQGVLFPKSQIPNPKSQIVTERD